MARLDTEVDNLNGCVGLPRKGHAGQSDGCESWCLSVPTTKPALGKNQAVSSMALGSGCVSKLRLQVLGCSSLHALPVVYPHLVPMNVLAAAGPLCSLALI